MLFFVRLIEAGVKIKEEQKKGPEAPLRSVARRAAAAFREKYPNYGLTGEVPVDMTERDFLAYNIIQLENDQSIWPAPPVALARKFKLVLNRASSESAPEANHGEAFLPTFGAGCSESIRESVNERVGASLMPPQERILTSYRQVERNITQPGTSSSGSLKY